jgi:hypothetical protein
VNMKVVEYFNTFLTNIDLHFSVEYSGSYDFFVISLSDIVSFRIQLTLSVLSDSLKLFRCRICLRHYGRFCSMFLDLSMEYLNTSFSVAVWEIRIFKLRTVVFWGQIKVTL